MVWFNASAIKFNVRLYEFTLCYIGVAVVGGKRAVGLREALLLFQHVVFGRKAKRASGNPC